MARTKTSQNLRDIDTEEKLVAFAKANGEQAVITLFRAYMEAGQPESFMPDYTFRALSRVAADALNANATDIYLASFC